MADDVVLTPSQALTTAVTILRRHAAVCSRHGEPQRLTEVADLIEGAVENHERLAAELDKTGLLRNEYPDQMAQRSCTCQPDAICGAHRLLARYNQLFEAFQQSNKEKREAKRKLRDLDVLATTDEPSAGVAAEPNEEAGDG